MCMRACMRTSERAHAWGVQGSDPQEPEFEVIAVTSDMGASSAWAASQYSYLLPSCLYLDCWGEALKLLISSTKWFSFSLPTVEITGVCWYWVPLNYILGTMIIPHTLLFCSVRDWTQGFGYARHMLYWAIAPFLKTEFVDLPSSI